MMRIKWRILSAVVAFLMFALASPVQGQIWNRIQRHVEKAQQVAQAVKPITTEEEVAIGREVAAKFIAYFHLDQDKELTRYVNEVGQTVAAQSERQDIKFHFAVLDSDDINAMSTPGGFVFITRGALKLCEDESELAGVLAHEVGHVSAKHVIRILERDKMLREGMNEASAYTPGSAYLQKMSQAVLVKVIDQGLAPEDEYDADARAVRYAHAAGYPADGLERFLTRLDQATNQGAHSFWTRTHPPVPDRNSRMAKLIAEKGWNDLDRNRLAGRYAAETQSLRAAPRANPAAVGKSGQPGR
jgi:predicted Zn-dependent protease